MSFSDRVTCENYHLNPWNSMVFVFCSVGIFFISLIKYLPTAKDKQKLTGQLNC